ncbi:hypothetical protein R69888_02482 [Paraburkholderia haematera]|uniref:Uncharacterized protein n=1 Tax=Paraburkholderia haematera TaxID=2793077 RepID=A0ABM8R993_9BURK|nr:hypothetical protein R69888_02482 [Paraburkholderia haematera]
MGRIVQIVQNVHYDRNARRLRNGGARSVFSKSLRDYACHLPSDLFACAAAAVNASAGFALPR